MIFELKLKLAIKDLLQEVQDQAFPTLKGPIPELVMCPGVQLHVPDVRGEDIVLNNLVMGLLSHNSFLWSYRTAHSLVTNSERTA